MQKIFKVEKPVRTETELDCPQRSWKSLMEKVMKETSDATHAKFAIHKAMEHKFGSRFFVTCDNKKVSFVTNGNGYCNSREGDLFCQVVALVA
ncbi:hypothetical protein QR680_016310 [Steinernema hermaphroditum]|uniref:Ground-like domain-containing protein n=1 Tax=Steinernema hermaphroditum TaxID=289476 RepID=A0AA39LM85_9BILA|nr:hypothetical protein QR680_016310 [Steinernema hermaphroditum]